MQNDLHERELIAQDIHAYLKQHQDKDLLRLLTCGSVDDGKSTLIGRLLFDCKMIYEDQLAAIENASVKKGSVAGETDLSLLTDGLRAEREQGITIDVAYRFFSTNKRKFIIADTPGHEQYTRNMATGASTADLAVVLIDARHGVLPQTKRHSFIASLLGIQHMVVAVNKMDAEGYQESVFNDIVEDYTAFAARLNIPDIRFIPLSALKGDNVVFGSENMPWYRGPTLLNVLETVHIGSDRNLIDFRLPIQLVCRPHLNFRGFQGSIAAGRVSVGDEICVQPSGKTSLVKEIWVGDTSAVTAHSPQAVTLTLEDEIDISRGDILVKPGNKATVGNLFEAMVVWMGEDSLQAGGSYWLKMGTQVVPATALDLRYSVDVNTLSQESECEALSLNGVGRILFETQRSVTFDPYTRSRSTGNFIIIDRLSNVTVGAGMILLKNSAELKQRTRETARYLQPSEHHYKTTISEAERTQRLGHPAYTLWLTGRPGAGKTTIATALEKALFSSGHTVTVLDGSRLRTTISQDLGFSIEDKRESCRRGAAVAELLNEQGQIVIATFVSGHERTRELVKEILGSEKYLEIHIDADAETLARRAQAKSTQNATAGEKRTQVYEAPEAPLLRIDTASQSEEECVKAILDKLQSLNRLKNKAE